MGAATKTFCFGITTVVVAYLYLRWQPDVLRKEADLNAIEQQMVDAWEKQIKYPKKPFSRLAVGTNGNIDLIVSGIELLDKLKQEPGKEHNHNRLTSLGDLQESFSYFFKRGRAAERLFTDADLYKEVVKAVYTLEKVEQFIGGNAALMAKNAASLFPDVKIQFVGPVGPILQKLMPKSISIPESSIAKQDEFHLIMEYKVGQEWGSTKAPVATRFICSYDASNSEMTMLETFFNNLDAFKPDLILLSGLHMLESLEPEFFESRLAALIQGLNKVDARIPVHLEFASMMDKNFMRSILEKAMSKVTSLGLNEQELAFASIAMNGPHSDHLEMSEGQPVIHIMSDLIHWMLSTYGKSSKRPDSRLTRIHFHSLTYHIVGVHKDHWKNVKSATMAGTRVAGHRACDTKESNPHFVDLQIPLEFKLYSGDVQRKFDPHNPAFTWTMGEFYFVFSPVLVCKHPLKTVGLGDAISATGLMFSEFSP